MRLVFLNQRRAAVCSTSLYSASSDTSWISKAQISSRCGSSAYHPLCSPAGRGTSSRCQPGNLMWYWGEDNTLIGVLNISSLATVRGPEGNERTRTVPFMALDFLTEKGRRGEVKHLYCHDLESFMWFSSGSFSVARMDGSYHGNPVLSTSGQLYPLKNVARRRHPFRIPFLTTHVTPQTNVSGNWSWIVSTCLTSSPADDGVCTMNSGDRQAKLGRSWARQLN
ncbi:hypothetical protein M405DRAFT_359559 [Rhizopogon salebrosus TDB-379]|nr:hypothetical protein M405DRAFT_359559 [Rhizopogon salebrosus TDB-379]